MSWLEYLGLAYLLDDDNALDFSGVGTGMLFLFGIGSWLLVAIFQGDLVDQGATVFNLLATVLLLVLTLIKYIRMLKSSVKNNVMKSVFYIFSLVVIIGSFVYGLYVPYHALLFNYEYKGVFSAIASTFYPLIILNILYPFFCKDSKVREKIQEGFETIGLVVISLIALFFIGQFATLIVSFTNNESLYQKVITYHNLSITETRNDWKYASVEDCINQLLPIDTKNFLENYQNTNTNMLNYKEQGDMESYQRHTLIYIHQNYPNGELNTNGISFSQMKWESPYIVNYVIIDKEYNKKYYVKFNYENYSIIDYIDSNEYSKIESYTLQF